MIIAHQTDVPGFRIRLLVQGLFSHPMGSVVLAARFGGSLLGVVMAVGAS
jgi:hypothetical protein